MGSWSKRVPTDERVYEKENGGVSVSASGCEQYMSILRYGQYGQVGADGVWRNKEKDNKKTGDKKVTKKTQKQYNEILAFMEPGREYDIWDFCELLNLKESRVKEILKGLSDYLEIVGSNRDRRYKKK